MDYPESRFTVSVPPGLAFLGDGQGGYSPIDLPLAAPEVHAEVDSDGEAKWYENGGESIDLSSLFARLEGGVLGEAFGGPRREEGPVFSVTKYGAYIPIAEPVAYEPVEVSRYQRIRNSVYTARLRLGEWVAGVKLQDEEDW